MSGCNCSSHHESEESARKLRDGWSVRAPNLADAEAICELFSARSQVLHGESQRTLDSVTGMLASARLDPERNVRILLEPDGGVVGWAHAVGEAPYVDISTSAALHPSVQGDERLWDSLFEWTQEHAETLVALAPPEARVAASARSNPSDDPRVAAIGRWGCHQVRVQNHMRIDMTERPAEPVWPEGIDLRTASIEEDLPDIVDAEAEAFRDHWGFVEAPPEQSIDAWKDGIRMAGDAHDPSLWFLSMDGDEIAAFAFSEDRTADDLTRGYLLGLAVRPAWRRRGIAEALLRHSFGALFDKGRRSVELDMDSENLTGALRLYERVGMRAIRQQILFEKELRAGEDIVTRELES